MRDEAVTFSDGPRANSSLTATDRYLKCGNWNGIPPEILPALLGLPWSGRDDSEPP